MTGIFDNTNVCINRNVCNDIRGFSLCLINITIANSPYNVTTEDNIILADVSGGQVIVNLFRGLKYLHPIFRIKKVDNSANNVRLLPGDVGTTIESAIQYDIDRPDEVA